MTSAPCQQYSCCITVRNIHMLTMAHRNSTSYKELLANLTEFLGNYDLYDNYEQFSGDNDTVPSAPDRNPRIELVRTYVVPVIYGIVTVLGFTGNLSIMFIVLSNKQMRNTTNLLIVNYALASFLFTVFFVSQTGVWYAMESWPFGNAFCKIYFYMFFVTAYSSALTLVIMSLDRYCAMVHPHSAVAMRLNRHVYIIICLPWLIILATNVPIVLDSETMTFDLYGEEHSTCNYAKDHRHVKILHGFLFAFHYMIPVVTICTLFVLICLCGGNQSAETVSSEKNATRMVGMVAVVFALCWLPINVLIMIHMSGHTPSAFYKLGMAFYSLAIANSSLNPLIYAFMSKDFRTSFKNLPCCKKGRSTTAEREGISNLALDIMEQA